MSKGQTLARFKNWLLNNKVYIVDTSLESVTFEIEKETSVVSYKTKKWYFSGAIAETIWGVYSTGGSISNSLKQSKRIIALLKRDGPNCCYCGEPLGRDITEEHFLSRSHKGGNGLANLALAHGRCNKEAGNLPIIEKIKLRERLQSKQKLQHSPNNGATTP